MGGLGFSGWSNKRLCGLDMDGYMAGRYGMDRMLGNEWS